MRTHPKSGRKAIYINPIRIEEIVGLSQAEALPLLDELLSARDAETSSSIATSGIPATW